MFQGSVKTGGHAYKRLQVMAFKDTKAVKGPRPLTREATPTSLPTDTRVFALAWGGIRITSEEIAGAFSAHLTMYAAEEAARTNP